MRRPWRPTSRTASRGIRTYSPHRSLIALGTILMTVAVAGGAFGVVESARAERTAALLTNQYLVLQPPVRAARTALANFQVLAAQAFGGSVSTALLDSAVVESADVDQTYLALQRLLSLPENAGLAPDLARLEAAYISSRTGLAAILAIGARSAKSAQVAATEEAAEKNLDNRLASLEATIDNLLVQTARQVHADTSDARNGLLGFLGLGLAFAILVTVKLTRKALQQERDMAGRDAVQARAARQNEFESRFQRALEMAKSEEPVFDLITQALSDAAPDGRTELLARGLEQGPFSTGFGFASNGGGARMRSGLTGRLPCRHSWAVNDLPREHGHRRLPLSARSGVLGSMCPGQHRRELGRCGPRHRRRRCSSFH